MTGRRHLPLDEPRSVDTSLSDQAYEQLLSEIMDGNLPPGSVLGQRSLARRLGMSPIPVREALRQLEKDGLIEMRSRWPARVKSQDENSIREEYVLREALEAQAARLCALNASKDQLDGLAHLGDQVDRLLRTGKEGSQQGPERHLEFHMEIARLSGSSALVKQLNLIGINAIIRRNWMRTATLTQAPLWHERIAVTIATRDPVKADQVVREHVQQGLRHELAMLRSRSRRITPRGSANSAREERHGENARSGA